MFSPMILGLSLLSLLSVSLALPAPQSDSDVATGINRADPIDVVAVEFQGTTIYINSEALVTPETSPNPTTAVKNSFKRVPYYDFCGSSAFLPHPGPFARSADCWVVRNYMESLPNESYWKVMGGKDNQGKIAWAGSCAFYAGTQNFYTTYIGWTDIRDLINDGVPRLQYNGDVAVQGDMGCNNIVGAIGGRSKVYWTVQRS